MIKCEMQILPKTVLAAAGIIFIGEVSMGWVGGYLWSAGCLKNTEVCCALSCVTDLACCCQSYRSVMWPSQSYRSVGCSWALVNLHFPNVVAADSSRPESWWLLPSPNQVCASLSQINPAPTKCNFTKCPPAHNAKCVLDWCGLLAQLLKCVPALR